MIKHTAFQILMAEVKEAGYTENPDDVLLCIEHEADGVKSFAVIVKDHVDGEFIVSEWLREQKDWISHPHFDGSLESCLEFVKHNF